MGGFHHQLFELKSGEHLHEGSCEWEVWGLGGSGPFNLMLEWA